MHLRAFRSNSPHAGQAALSLAVLLLLACGQSVVSKPESSESAEAEQPAPEVAAAEPAPAVPCAGGAIKDDGSVETGYGFVPSATMGQYVQEFHSGELPSRELSEVCVCWLRTRDDSDIDFEVIFHQDVEGRPAPEPYATVAATATEVPNGVDAAGRFYPVDVSEVTLAEGTSYIGVRWDPSASQLFFVCTDTSEETEMVSVYSAEDRAPAWVHVKESRDPIFRPHRSILLRAKAAN